MRAGLILLCLAYVLSQFFRTFLAVLAQALEADIGASPDDLAVASGLWFLAFALMQIPVGWLLDRSGPRRTASALLLIGGAGGAALFAVAQAPAHISAAMLLIGIGCSPVLMASYYIFAREFPPARFATLAALMLGIGSVGNLGASFPLTLVVELIGWRGALWALAGLSAIVALGILGAVRDPQKADESSEGSLLSLLKMPVLWAILPMMLVNYAPSGAMRGLWIGPYLEDVYHLSERQIGASTLLMGLAMIVGTIAYGPLDRVLKTRKWVILTGNLLGALAIFALVFWIDANVWFSVALLAMIGLLGASFPVLIAHGRAFFPPHLVGRGVTLLNLFGIGGVGLAQFATGRIHQQMSGTDPAAAYSAVFGFLGGALLIGALIYMFSRDSVD